MLVLSRRVGESIIIDDLIEITVIDVQNGKVRLGIRAPDNVRVDRKEVHERRQAFLAPVEEGALRAPVSPDQRWLLEKPREVAAKAKQVSREFEALFAESIKRPPEQRTSG